MTRRDVTKVIVVLVAIHSLLAVGIWSAVNRYDTPLVIILTVAALTAIVASLAIVKLIFAEPSSESEERRGPERFSNLYETESAAPARPLYPDEPKLRPFNRIDRALGEEDPAEEEWRKRFVEQRRNSHEQRQTVRSSLLRLLVTTACVGVLAASGFIFGNKLLAGRHRPDDAVRVTKPEPRAPVSSQPREGEDNTAPVEVPKPAVEPPKPEPRAVEPPKIVEPPKVKEPRSAAKTTPPKSPPRASNQEKKPAQLDRVQAIASRMVAALGYAEAEKSALENTKKYSAGDPNFTYWRDVADTIRKHRLDQPRGAD